jgi:ubiquinone/menaquinone biosynthesis C-methylase UbiE
MHERRFDREIERLRDPERIARLEIERVIDLSLKGLEDVNTVLDVGTGSGLFAEAFAIKGLQITGLDAKLEMLPVAYQYVTTGAFIEGIAENLPFPDSSFDLVFMGLSLHETDNMLNTLREAHRVALQRLVILEWPDEDQAFGPPREHRLSYEKISSLAYQSGFKEILQTRLENLTLYYANSIHTVSPGIKLNSRSI